MTGALLPDWLSSDGAREATLLGATVAMGLAAGVFYTFSCSVMLALRRVDDRTFIDVMQRINAAIQNGWFALSFMGAFLLTALATWQQLDDDRGAALRPVAAALGCYLLTMIMTFRVNIPLNVALDRAGAPHAIAEPATVRRRFEARWNRWNVLRALTSTAGFVLLCWALTRPAA